MAAPTTGPTAGWSLSSTGANTFAGFTTGIGDTLNYGNGATGLAAGTITFSGTASAGAITFESGSGAILLSCVNTYTTFVDIPTGTVNIASGGSISTNSGQNFFQATLTAPPAARSWTTQAGR